MKMPYLIVGGFALALAGCGGDPVKLHAFEGPLASATPGLILDAQTQGDGNTGKLSYKLPDGVTCTGPWQRVSNVIQTKDMIPVPNTGMVQSHGGISSKGEGNALANRARMSQIEGTGTCSNGVTYEFASYADGYHGRGALRDSNGNVFRIMLR